MTTAVVTAVVVSVTSVVVLVTAKLVLMTAAVLQAAVVTERIV